MTHFSSVLRQLFYVSVELVFEFTCEFASVVIIQFSKLISLIGPCFDTNNSKVVSFFVVVVVLISKLITFLIRGVVSFRMMQEGTTGKAQSTDFIFHISK